MQIVSDRGMDLTPELVKDLNIHQVPLRISLDGKSYESGVDLIPTDFYRLLSATTSYPTTSQPSVGDFTTLYQKLAEFDPNILSIHISSGLSGTINSARAAAQIVTNARITIFDTLTLSGPEGWLVEAAARAIKAGWPLEKVVTMLEKLRNDTQGIFTLTNLKYLIHGGRISHIKGLLASVLNIKPIIYVERIHGTYQPVGQEMTFKRALYKIVDVLSNWYPRETKLRIQPLHGDNLEGVEILREKLGQFFEIHWEPTLAVAPVLGAHTGPSVVGLAVAPMAAFEQFG
jgi:DegV family protein with EDD domain